MKAIQYEIVKEIAVLSTSESGYTKEINLISWNGKEPKYDIRTFSPNREKCGVDHQIICTYFCQIILTQFCHIPLVHAY